MKKVIVTKVDGGKAFPPDFHQKTLVKEPVNPELGSRLLQFRISTMSPGGRDEYHTHPNSEQIMYVLKGKGKIGVGREICSLSKDVLVFIPAGMRHHIENSGKVPLQFICLWDQPPSSIDWVPPE